MIGDHSDVGLRIDLEHRSALEAELKHHGYLRSDRQRIPPVPCSNSHQTGPLRRSRLRKPRSVCLAERKWHMVQRRLLDYSHHIEMDYVTSDDGRADPDSHAVDSCHGSTLRDSICIGDSYAVV